MKFSQGARRVRINSATDNSHSPIGLTISIRAFGVFPRLPGSRSLETLFLHLGIRSRRGTWSFNQQGEAFPVGFEIQKEQGKKRGLW